MSCKVSEEVKDILDKIDKYREKNNKPKDEKVKPLSEYELNRLPKLPDKWSWVLSNDISTFITNGVHSPTSQQDLLNINMKMLRITDIDENGKSDLTGLPYCTRFTEKDYDKTIKRNDIYISFTGNKLGKRYLAKQSYNDIVFAHYFVRWQPIIVNPRYIYYVVLSHHFDRFMFEHTLGSAQPNLKVTDLKRVPIPLAPLEEQEKIANILSSLDDKIELNNEMNKTLEEMAQSIFKRWFVDFEFPNEDGQSYKSSGGEMVESELGMIPKGWEVKELGEVININPRESLKKGEEKIYVEMANLPLNYARITNYIEKPFNGGTKFRNGDTLLARITPCLENGKTAIVDFLEENDLAFGSTEYIVMRPKVLNQYYIYCLSRNEDFRNYAIKNMNGSSGRQRVDANTIKQYRIPCPDENTLELYNQFCVSLFNQMKKNDDESKVLGDIRDTLLHKLMSGDIK